MTGDPFPRDAIFIRYGRLTIGAFGRLAVAGLLTFGTAAIAGHMLNWW